MKRRIAISLECPLMQHGGVEVLVQGLLEGLTESYEIILISTDRNIDAIPRPFRDYITGHIYWCSQAVTYGASLRLARQLKKEKVELVHFNFGGFYGYGGRILGKCPVVACSWLGIPSITTVHFMESAFEGYIGQRKPWWIKKALWPFVWSSRLLTLLSAKQEITVSNHDMERMLSWFGPWGNRISRLYHSRLKEEEQPIDLSRREPLILSVGTLCPRKGQIFLVRAFAQIAQTYPEWKLYIIGRESDDVTIPQLRAEIASAGLGDRIVLTGPMDASPIFEQMLRASVFVMPSLVEPLGLSLQEALYYGCPAVGSRVGGIPELIDDEINGLLVPPGDVDKLAEALNRILSDDAFRHRLAKEARPSIIRKGMTYRQMIGNYSRIYDSHLSRQ